jgi:exodeoxyribonuclease V alpha subunit
MNNMITSPFQPIDIALAKRVGEWHKTEDSLLLQTVLATSFALQQGHSCLSIEDCLNESPYNEMSEFGYEDFPNAKEWLAKLQAFDLSATSTSPIVLHNKRVYLRRYFQFETELVEFYSQRRLERHTLSSAQTKQAKVYLDLYFPRSEQVDWQRAAAINALYSSLNIITGGPGTGKTHTVTRILATLAGISEQKPVIKLAAPTGKAAQRLAESIRQAKQSMQLDMFINEAIPNEAYTLHRLLGVIPNSIHFRHNEKNPIDADILLIDEASMIDLPLMTRLVRAIKPNTRLIILGDADQLPSVAAGSVLTDLIERPHPGYSAERIKQLKELGIKIEEQPATSESTSRNDLTELSFSRRFAGGSGIGKLASCVIKGDVKPSIQLFETEDDLTWLPYTPIQTVLREWTSQYYRGIAKQSSLAEAFEQLKQFRILCAHREGDLGVEAINEFIGNLLNHNRTPFYQGQPIMVTQNHYGLKLFNGDIGLVWPNEHGQLMVWFEAEQEPRAITPGRLPSHETVYAMTIHKTQGSEFSHVAMVLPENTSAIVTRELIYTGLTRAKQAFTLMANELVWKKGITGHVTRWAGLSDRLRQKEEEQ